MLISCRFAFSLVLVGNFEFSLREACSFEGMWKICEFGEDHVISLGLFLGYELTVSVACLACFRGADGGNREGDCREGSAVDLKCF